MVWNELRDFVFHYYIYPIIHDTGYNPINTITWALILAPLCVILVLKVLRRLHLTIDEAFIAAVVPYILLGSVLRVIEDAELVSPPVSYILISPLIYLVLILSTLMLLGVALKIAPWRYKSVFAATGMVLFVVCLVFLMCNEVLKFWWVIPAVCGISGIIVTAIYLTGRELHLHFSTTRIYLAAIGAHMLDAASSYIGIDLLAYHGKHVLENLVVNLTGTAAGMFILKLGVLIPVLYLIDTGLKDDKELGNMIILTIIIVGLAPGVRNSLRMTFGI